MINKTGKAKEDIERAELEEVLNKEYVKLETKSKYNSVANLDDAVEAVKNQGYNDRIVGVSGGGYKLSKKNIMLSKTGEDNTDTITIEKDTSASSGGTWYALINGKYFKIEEDGRDIKIAKESSNVNPSSGTSGDTINITNSDVTLANANIATFQVTEGKNIQLTASNEGSSTITITANGITYTANLTVVGSFEQAPANLDGAVELLAATDNSNQNGENVTLQNIEMTTSNPDVATVTTEGIVKCNKVAGKTAIISAKQGGTTRYFKINSTATLATQTKMDSNKTINGQSTGTANNPIIPKGFYPINTEKAKWTFDSTNNKVTDVDKGLVIMDEKGNQFVWVPVSNPNSMYGTLSNGKKAGKLYTDWSGTGSEGTKSNNNWSETNGVMSIDSSSYREPATLSDGKYLSIITDVIKTKYKSNHEYDNITNFENTMQNDFDKMIASVISNGGFYIGRYEASLINNETRVVAGATSMSATNDSANNWHGSYARQRNFADDNGLTSVESSMVWGSQYDAMLNWMQSTGIDARAEASSSNNTARNSDTNRRTGVVANDKINNIYDIFGLRFEWTMEAYNTYNRILRGGTCDSYYSPSFRWGDNPVDTYPYRDGSRSTLYIK